MLVSELIQHLQTMPPDAVVIHQFCSESVGMEVEQITLEENYIERHGTWMKYNPKTWDIVTDGMPDLHTVCHFPGN
jgi:hypothetical protein